MARPLLLLYYMSHRRFTDSLRGFFFIPAALALVTSLSVLVYISSTSNFFYHTHQTSLQFIHPDDLSTFFQPTTRTIQISYSIDSFLSPKFAEPDTNSQLPNNQGSYLESDELFHNTRDIFLKNYEEMNKSFKIFVYPHRKTDQFAHAFLPVDFEPGGNYASESYFKKVLMKSHFITKDASKADLFFMPFSIARLRHDSRVGVEGIQDFVKEYIFNISHLYPYWNRTGGADHFYVACHSIGRSAMDKAEEVKFNAIQVVCSSSYFLSGYIPHKDASLPQIWPRHDEPLDVASSKREQLAFFAGSINSPVRHKLHELWGIDSEISVHFGRLTTSYDQEILKSKFCLHVKGYEVNTARISDAIYYGCVPVIIANHYDLPFSDILNWNSFSVVVATLDIPILKKVLKQINSSEYQKLQSNVFKVRKHFQWHTSPVDYDAFYMVMYELWLRRTLLRVPLSDFMDANI
ncbi:probable glycosyltransferase At5g03795 isoform X2 [Impatiens glandulifera]|uniref:probable glycosyltransferase At5g03795 isoform X2 n=1 Tax=Impatiens glandulifera TaxID=253017 RepID=UPI001FB19D5F|nr:probable glycosyltransferase At5g03795 isoform X2 [Impatiens glandulifera]